MNAIWIQIFKIAGGIGTGLGAICFLATLFFQYASKREERSVSSIIGHTQLRAEDVLQILKEFKDDPQGRLKALELLMHGQREQARQILEKLKSGIDVDKVSQHQDQRTLKLFKSMGLITGALGILLLAIGLIEPKNLKLITWATPDSGHADISPIATNPVAMSNNVLPNIPQSKQTNWQAMVNMLFSDTNDFLTRTAQNMASSNSSKKHVGLFTPEQNYYIVKSGDTLKKIANHFGVTVESIMTANFADPLQAPRIKVGQRIYIPKPTYIPQPAFN